MSLTTPTLATHISDLFTLLGDAGEAADDGATIHRGEAVATVAVMLLADARELTDAQAVEIHEALQGAPCPVWSIMAHIRLLGESADAGGEDIPLGDIVPWAASALLATPTSDQAAQVAAAMGGGE